MHEALHLATVASNYVVAHKNEILALVGGTAGLWAVVQTVLVKLKINGPRLSFLLAHLAAFLTALTNYWFSSGNPNVFVNFAWIAVVLQGWHHLLLNPGYKKYFLPFLQWLATQKAGGSPAVVAAEATADVPSTFA